MLVQLVYHAVMWLNAFPPKGGVSPIISPRSLITGVPLDYKKHCQLAFGSYAQTHEEPEQTNSLNTRTVGAIGLGPTGNLQGSYKFLSLRSGKLITRRTWTALPMPQEVIDRINAIGMSQDQPKLLTFYDRKGELVGDLAEPSIQTEDPSDIEPETLNAPSTEEIDPLPDLDVDVDSLEPPELDDHYQLADPQDEPPLDPPTMMLDIPESPPGPIIVDEGVDADPGLRRSTRTRAEPSSYIPSFTGKRYKAAALFLAQQEPDYAFVSHVIMTQFSMKAGLKKLGNRGTTAVSQELTQLHLRDTFEPLHK